MKYIPIRHINRMFPFEFFQELNERWDQWVPENPAFTIPYTTSFKFLKDFDKKAIFTETRNTPNAKMLREIIAKNNIINLDLFPVLIIEPYVKKESINTQTGKADSTNSNFLVVQYFDSTHRPIFANDVTLQSIRPIPEILFDDPNLFIGVTTFSEEDGDSQIAVLRAPDFIADNLTTGETTK